MIKQIIHDPFFLGQKSEIATKADIQVANDLLDSAIIAKVDVDECESLAIKYGVSSIPCLIVFKNGVVVDKRVGLSDKSTLTSMIVKHI